MHRTLARYVVALSFTAMAGLAPAYATFHLMVVQEVFPGTPANPGAQYVMLRFTSSGQQSVLNTFIEAQDAAGNVLGRFGTFDHNVANGGTFGCAYPACPAIVIGTSAAETLLGFAFDQVVDAQAGHALLPPAGGRLCFRGSTGSEVDCVAWGPFAGSNLIPTPTVNGCDANFGSPAPALSSGFALTRKQFNCAAKENSVDFENRFPHPVANNNANANTDSDADGLVNVLDCGDADATSLYFPTEVSGGDVTGPPTTVSWGTQNGTSGTSTRYDVVTGMLADLFASRDFGTAACLGPGVNGASLADPRPDPPPGEGFYYLVRARNGCGRGTYGDSSLTPDPRDALDSPGSFPCP